MSAAASTRASAALKAIDRWAGIPLVLALAALRRRRPIPPRPRRIAVLKLAAIGDTILLAPVVEALARAHGQAELRLFLGPSNQAVAALTRLPTEVLPIRRPRRALAAVRAFAPDLVIDCEAWARLSALIAGASGCAAIGFATDGQHRHAAFDLAVPHGRSLHEYQNYQSLLAVLGARAPRLPTLDLPAQAAEAPLPSPYAILHPWSGGFLGERKEWPRGHWAALARQLRAHGLGVAICGSAQDRARAEALVAELGGGAISIAGRYTLAELGGVARRAAVVVSVNTGIMHLAAAAGAAVVAINGPVPHQRWGALGARAINVAAPGDDCGFLHLGFEYAGHPSDCMARISPERVWSAVRALKVLSA